VITNFFCLDNLLAQEARLQFKVVQAMTLPEQHAIYLNAYLYNVNLIIEEDHYLQLYQLKEDHQL